MSLAQAVKAEAQRLGFQLVGITSPDPPPHFSTFERWLAAGRAGEMAYLAGERSRLRRSDPRQILPECQSILVLGIRYPAPVERVSRFVTEEPETKVSHPESNICHPERSEESQTVLDGDPSSQSTLLRRTGESESLTGRVAAYAWGDDYHAVLPGRLQALVAFLEAQAGRPIPNRWYTDTGPVLERDLAQRAGLGWIGKNTCLIHPRLGSYFLLAEILLGIELEPDPPFLADHCGTCTRCLEACPTSCILPDRTLDASRCLSYLTIEVKGAIPEDLRSQMGTWVFGCDICQQVCPWNRKIASQPASLQGYSDFAPRPQVPSPDLVQELSLAPEDFNHKFKSSPVKRAKRRGYLRNVAVVLGNLNSGGKPHPAAVAALAHALLNDPEPLVRGHTAWALGRIGGEAAGSALEEAAAREVDGSVLAEIRSARDHLGRPRSQE